MGQYIKDSTVINSEFECRYINITTASDLKEKKSGKVRKLGKLFKLFREVRRGVKEFEPDLVYVTPNAKGASFLFKEFPIVQMVKRMGRKVIVHYHNKGVSKWQDNPIFNLIYKRFFKGIKVILLSELLYPDISKYVKREDVFICPNGIPDAKTPVKVERNNEVPRLLFLSNLLESKGVLVLLDACKILKEKGYKFVCDFVGAETTEINATRFNNEIADRGLSDCVLYLGKKYGREKEDILNKDDIFVFPTFYSNECFPLVVEEAMQHGMPIISTMEGAISDMVVNNYNGYIVPAKSAKELSEAILKLLNDVELRISMGRNSIELYERKYRLAIFETNMLKCLKGGL